MRSDSELVVRDRSVRPRDEVARAGRADHLRFGPREPASPSRSSSTSPHVGSDGIAAAAVVDHALGFGTYLRGRAAELMAIATLPWWRANPAIWFTPR